MGVALINDGLPTRNHPKIEEFLSRAEDLAVGQTVAEVRYRQVKNSEGAAASVLQVKLENGHSLLFFSPLAYAIADPARELPVSGEG